MDVLSNLNKRIKHVELTYQANDQVSEARESDGQTKLVGQVNE